MTIAMLSSLVLSSGILAAPASTASAAAAPSGDVRRQEIFQTLRGGEAALSSDVTAHLWKLAGSLSRTPWTPPATHVHVVVRRLEPGR